MTDFCQLWLTCADSAKADKLAKTLLTKHLVACVRQSPIVSDYRWQGKIEHEAEVLIIMTSRIDLFDQVEREVTKLHSYDTFVLEAVPIVKASKAAQKWLNEELNGKA
jgi:periplasmic divalent cation tolerance protein